MAVPSKRLSFVTPSDQQQFGQLFQSALRPGENAMDGDTARVVLMRSQLPTQVLGDIWQLCDTTRSGTLLFPEFCLAMSLCAAVRRGEPLPRELHPGLLKEISDMVDQISFAVPDSQPNEFDRLQQQQTGWQQQSALQQPQQTGFQQPYQYPQGYGFQAQPTGFQSGVQSQSTGYAAPQYGAGVQSQYTGVPQATPGLQSQATGGYSGLQSQATGGYTGLQSQATGGYSGLQPQTTGGYSGLQPQTTGGYSGLQPQTTGGYSGLQPQTTGGYSGLQPQTTGGYSGLQPQTTGGYSGLQPQTTGGYSGLQPQTTGGYSNLQPQTTGGYSNLQPQTTGGYTPLSSQPTGKPGQWGFTNQAAPGIENFVGVFTGQGQAQQPQQSGNTIGTAISKTEKAKFDDIFASWDPQRSGFISGGSAIQNFSKSGLPQQDLEQIWALSDPTDRGKLNRDEFAVAMHLIYRRLNGYDIPQQLPPELLPPSSRHLQDSLNQVKQFLKNAPTGTSGTNSSVSYLKSNSFASSKPRKDATVFKNDDQAGSTYKSANRHKAAPKPNKPASMQPNSLAELSKAIKEKKILLEALDAEDEEDKVAQSSIERDNQKAVEELKIKIRNVQKDLDKKQPKATQSVDKRQLLSKLEGLTDALPQLTMSIRKIEQEIAVAKVEVVRKKYEKDHPGFQIQGTGPGGEITEQDRAAARRKAELRARMSAITGRQLDGSNSYEEFEKILLKATQQTAQDRETHEQSLRALEESTRAVKRDLDHQLRDAAGDMKEDRDRRRWDEAIGVEPEVKAFIEELRPGGTSANGGASGSAGGSTGNLPGVPATTFTASANTTSSSATANTTAKETPAERVARIRAEAERRTRERFAKAGIQMRGKRDNGQETKSEPKAETPEIPKEDVSEPKPEPKPEPKAAPKAKPKPEPKAVPQAMPAVAEPTHSADSSDDEEAAQLQKENEDMQRRLREKEEEAKARKAAKAKEKSERLAELKRQQEEMKKREASLSAQSDSEEEPEVSKNPFGKKEIKAEVPKAGAGASQVQAHQPPKAPQTTSEPQFKPPQPKVEQNTTPQPKTEPKAEPPKTTPAALPRAPPQTSARAAPNPFGPRPTKPADDDDWGSDNDDSDDDGPGRANAAQLASMLFGSMGGAPPRATESPQVSRAESRATQPASSQAPSAPVASLAESHPAPVAPQADAPPAPKAPELPAMSAGESVSESFSESFSEPFSAPPAPPSEPFSAPPAPPSEPFSAPPAPPSEPFSAPPVPPSEPMSAPPPPPSEPSFSAPPPPVPSFTAPSARDEDEFVSADEDFEEPPSAPPAPPSAPPAPPSAPPAPPSAPPAPPSAPPAPPSAPPAPPTAPPAPPTAPPAPPTAPPAPPSAPAAAAPAMPAGMASLLGDITKGKQLRKVDPSQQKISNQDLGKVL